MFSFFKRLVGLKNSEAIILVPSESSAKTNQEVSKTEVDKLSYDIDKVRAQVSKIEKEEGSQSIIFYLRDLFDNNHLKFNHLISFLKVLILNMKRAKFYEADEIFTYVNNQIEKYPEKNKVEKFSVIADIFGRISTKYSIKYLEDYINPPETDTFKDISYFFPMITLSDFYKDVEKAAELRNRAISIFLKNENDLDFKSLISILRTLLTSIRKRDGKIDQQYVDFINEHLKEYLGNVDLETRKRIAELYELVSIEYSISYLETISDRTTTEDGFNLSLKLSDSFLKSKDYDNAFKSLAKANLLLSTYSAHSFDAYERGIYIGNLIKIKDRQGEICIKEKNPKYDYFLINYLESFALDIARDLVSFPHISGFYYRKEIQYSPYSDNDGYDSLEISPDEDTNLYVALKKLKIFQWRKNIFKEYLDFIYNELPIIYGISPKYNQESIKRIFDAQELNSEEWNDLVFIFPDKLNKQSITKLTFEINRFVTNLLKKYYDLGNQ